MLHATKLANHAKTSQLNAYNALQDSLDLTDNVSAPVLTELISKNPSDNAYHALKPAKLAAQKTYAYLALIQALFPLPESATPASTLAKAAPLIYQFVTLVLITSSFLVGSVLLHAHLALDQSMESVVAPVEFS